MPAPGDTYAGVTVPEGDPEAVRGLGRTFRGMAGSLGRSSTAFSSLPSDLPHWQGPSSVAFAQTALESRDAATRGAKAFALKAVAADHLAEQLDHAQERARTAIADARDAKQRIRAAKVDIADAVRRLDQARIDAAAAEMAIAVCDPISGPPGWAIEARDRARIEAERARDDEGRARKRLGAARTDLDDARRLGSKAETQAEIAVQDANRSFGQIAGDVPALVPLGGPAASAGGGQPNHFREANYLRSLLAAPGTGSAARLKGLDRLLMGKEASKRYSAGNALVRGAGSFGESPAGKLSRRLGPLGYPLSYASDRSEGRSALNSLGHTASSAVAGFFGGLAGAAVCGTETVATAGAGAVACPVLVTGGATVASAGGGAAFDAGFGGAPEKPKHAVRAIDPMVPIETLRKAETITPKHHPLVSLPELRLSGGRQLQPLAGVGK